MKSRDTIAYDCMKIQFLLPPFHVGKTLVRYTQYNLNFVVQKRSAYLLNTGSFYVK